MAIADNLPKSWRISPVTGLPVRTDGVRLMRCPEFSDRPFVIYNDRGRRLRYHRGHKQLPYRFETTREAIAVADRRITLVEQAPRQ